MVGRRKSALAAIAVVAVGGWLGLFAAPAAAGPVTFSDGEVAQSVTTTAGPARVLRTATTGAVNAAASENVCRTHNTYYRIYVRGTGQNLFIWTFSTDYCFLKNEFWYKFLHSHRVTLRNPAIRGGTVDGKIYALNGINSSLMLEYKGASFQYCPGGTCRQTFTPRLAWAYSLNDTKVYLGDVPLE